MKIQAKPTMMIVIKTQSAQLESALRESAQLESALFESVLFESVPAWEESPPGFGWSSYSIFYAEDI